MTRKRTAGSKSLLASLPSSLRQAITGQSLQPIAQAILPEALLALAPAKGTEQVGELTSDSAVLGVKRLGVDKQGDEAQSSSQ